MHMYDILAKKREGLALSREEIEFFIRGFTAGEIPDYQASALLMAICIQGMDERGNRRPDPFHGPFRGNGGFIPNPRGQRGQTQHRRRGG